MVGKEIVCAMKWLRKSCQVGVCVMFVSCVLCFDKSPGWYSPHPGLRELYCIIRGYMRIYMCECKRVL